MYNRVNVNVLASTSVPFRPTTVQVPNLALSWHETANSVHCTVYTTGTLIIYKRPLGSALHRYLLCDLMQGNIRKKAKSEQRNSLPCTNIMKETPRRITVTSSLNQLGKRVVGGGGITFHSRPFIQQAYWKTTWTVFSISNICFVTNTLLGPNAGDKVRKFYTSQDQYSFDRINESKAWYILRFLHDAKIPHRAVSLWPHYHAVGYSLNDNSA